MVFKRFKTGFVARLVLLMVLAVLLVLCLLTWKLYYSSAVVAFVMVLLVIEFFRYVTITNQKLTQFLLALKYNDFTSTRVTFKDNSFKELNEAFQVVTDEFKILLEKQAFDNLLLQQILEHIPVGIICISHTNEILFYNRAALDMLHTEHLIDLDYLHKTNPLIHQLLVSVKDDADAGDNLFRLEQNEAVLVKAKSFTFGARKYRIFSLHNINNEMDRLEIESWQKLIRVITHEIMNSITPITSLAATLEDMTTQSIARKDVLTEEDWNDTLLGLKTIRQRSEGLLNFVENYRMLARFPAAVKKALPVRDVFERLQLLVTPSLLDKNIDLQFSLADNAAGIYADAAQLEQALINLVKNASEALEGRSGGKIVLEGQVEGEKVIISVADNGVGIPAEYMDKIFIPFYTTREKGSGIGLTLARQLIINNGGNISVRSVPAVGTEFKLVFGKHEH